MIVKSINVNEYTPFTIISTNTDIVQIAGIVTKEDIDKSKKQGKNINTKEIKIKKRKTP